MLFLISPAKKLNVGSENRDYSSLYSEPIFVKESETILKEVLKLSQKSLIDLMKISDNIATLNFKRYRDISRGEAELKPAILSFFGAVYTSLDVRSLDDRAFKYLDDNLRVLSGFYGLLRPMDLIAPYRLEMGSKLNILDCKDLYVFWQDKITDLLITEINAKEKKGGERVIVNLASKEYSSVLNRSLLKENKIKIIDVEFKERKKIDSNNIKYQEKDSEVFSDKTIVLYSKQARGLLVRFAAENSIKTESELKDFNLHRYAVDKSLSVDNKIVFYR